MLGVWGFDGGGLWYVRYLWFTCLWFVVYMLAQALDAELDDGADKWEALERCVLTCD